MQSVLEPSAKSTIILAFIQKKNEKAAPRCRALEPLVEKSRNPTTR